MDPAMILGVVLAFGGVIGAIFMQGASPMALILPSPMLLVFAGTIGAALASGVLRDGIGAVRAIPKALTARVGDPTQTIDVVVSLAERARREGLLALEDAARDVDDEFLRSGLQSAIDGTDPDDLRDMLLDRVDTKRAADRVTAKIFQDMGGFAPTIGIIGTVIELVHVLSNLDDPGSLGPMIAAAFVATLWGIMSANLMWLPLGNRLRRVSDLECAQMELAVEGLLAIQAGANPRLIGERLRSLLPPTATASNSGGTDRAAA